MTRVYVGGLPPNMRTDDVHDIFRRYDPLRVDMKMGFCFIEFREMRDADDAIHDMDGYKVEGKRLSVQPAKGRGAREGGGRDFGGPFGGPPGGGGSGGYGRPPPPGGGRPMGRRGGEGFQVEVEGLDGRTSWQDLKDFARGAGNVTYADVFVENGKVSQRCGRPSSHTAPPSPSPPRVSSLPHSHNLHHYCLSSVLTLSSLLLLCRKWGQPHAAQTGGGDELARREVVAARLRSGGRC